MKTPVLIFGATDKGKIVADILQQSGIMVYGFLDDEPSLQQKPFFHASVVSTTQDPDILALLNKECAAFIALEDVRAYTVLCNQLRQKCEKLILVNAIHPSVILTDVRIGEGNCLQAGVHIDPEVIISSHCTLQNRVTLQCNTTLHNGVHIGAGTVVGPYVCIEENVTIGPNVTIQGHVTIGEGTQIPAGAIIHDDIPAFTKLPQVRNIHI